MVDYWSRLESLMVDDWDATRLAAELKVSYQAVKKVRDGGAFGSVNNFKAANLFGVNPEWLASGKGNKYPAAIFPSVRAAEEATTYGTSPLGRAQAAINLEAPTLAQAIRCLSGYLEPMDATTKRRVGGLLADLVEDPQAHEQIAAMMEAALRSARPRVETR